VVNAVAGSGKTTTLVHAIEAIQSDSILLVAFNKHSAEELERRVGGRARARTAHSIGYGALIAHLGNATLNENKYHALARNMIDGMYPNAKYQARMGYTRAFEGLARFARLTCIDPRDQFAIEQMADRYNIEDANDRLIGSLYRLLSNGEQIASDQHAIDYTDMLYLPVHWQARTPKYDWVLVDECQDLSAVQRALVLDLRAAGGRMIFVGDPHQSIYGFAGADTASFDEIVKETSATCLPLSVCYRCPTSHVRLAAQLVPHIEARSDAPTGTVLDIEESDFEKNVQEGDLILCRKSAPLVKWCIRLIAHKMPARMRGRDFGKELGNLALKIDELHPYPYSEFGNAISDYAETQSVKLSQKEGNVKRIETLHDKCEAVRACWEGFKATTVGIMVKQIESIFNDAKTSITLSTVHGAKGLEANRVLILEPGSLPLVWKKQSDEQFQQEQNVKYVALTRAKQTLVFVHPPQNDKPVTLHQKEVPWNS